MLKDVREWAKYNDLTIETSGYGKGTKYTLYRKGKFVTTESSPWKLRDAAYAAAPYVLGHLEEEAAPKLRWMDRLVGKKVDAQTFIEQAYEALEPQTEEEFLLAMVDHPEADWGLARSFFRQQSATKEVA